MQIRNQQQGGEVSVSSVVDPGTTVARSRRRMVWLAFTAVVACAALVILGLTFSLRGTPSVPAAQPAAAPASGTSNGDTLGSIRLNRASGWLDGLAAGVILPSDVLARLETQDPSLARTVMAAWSDLDSAGRTSLKARKALGWVDGLAAGVISPLDVAARLETRDPRMAKAVMAAWSDLNAS